ncbi:hypothetical protein [Novosphingobium sp. PASSN1]|uniref:hypothetical protein n=1 Tax=Novosphingobium sp. PASSN1 TaxID=2015561 RepID=UPI000BD290BF|nr:hypothetical protein [Novosphingobium sp. PASSN1]OYU37296.1 MAG: hypothetical protein CFE35_02750 [Novosphingobium sp. PASSN1]
MTDRNDQPTEFVAPRNWEGLAEFDRALADNRLTEYRIKKAWADPINRAVTILVCLILAAYVGYVVINDFIL